MSKIQIDRFCPVGIGGTKGIDESQLKLFIGGLSPKQTSKDLFDIFAKYGTIREAVVIPDRFRVRSKCYGFVQFSVSTQTYNIYKPNHDIQTRLHSKTPNLYPKYLVIYRWNQQMASQ